MTMRIMIVPLLPAVLLLGFASAGAQTREEAERQLDEILRETAPPSPAARSQARRAPARAEFRGPIVIPLDDDDLRARKNEALRRFEDQQKLDIERDLRDALRK